MPRAVKFDRYGGIDVLRIVEVDRPVPGPEQVIIRMKAAGINPGEAAIREGTFAKQWPATFPSGQGSDLAGVVEAVGNAVRNVAVGDEVVGFTNNRSSHAELVVFRLPWMAVGFVWMSPRAAGRRPSVKDDAE